MFSGDNLQQEARFHPLSAALRGGYACRVFKDKTNINNGVSIMRDKAVKFIYGLVAVLLVSGSGVLAAKQNEPAVVTAALTEKGRKLEAQYKAQLDALKDELIKAVPQIDEGKKSVFLKARAAEKAAEAERNARQAALGKVGGAAALVGHAKNKWIGGAEAGIAKAQEALKKATTDAEREAARKDLANWQKNKEDGIAALKEREAALEQAKLEEPKLIKELEEAEERLIKAQADTLKALKDLNVDDFLASDDLDEKLVKFVVLSEATPNRMAELAEKGEAKKKLVESLLKDHELMKQMLIADGAKDGKYGRAMEIYADIQNASAKAKDGVLQRLALAISLEHAVPVNQGNPAAKNDAPATVDPVKRYLQYEKAFVNGELDPGFKDLSVWDLRLVVDGDEPDETIVWGREMLRNYRPDHISMPDYRWRYVKAVATEVKYGSGDQKFDRPELQSYQNIIANGGVCGRRAFFGRFILRAFGVPTTARPQSGHAALVHWTPDGWVACLGAGWGGGWTKTLYHSDLDFLASTQARAAGAAFMKVKRAQWVGDILGEKRTYGLHDKGEPELWNGVSLYVQQAVIRESRAKTLAAVGEDIGEANESKEKEEVKQVVLTDEDKAVVTGDDGTITIPAVACSKPTASTGKIIFMNSYLGGKQLHYSRNGGQENFEYTFDAPQAGKYELTARVVTTSANQVLLVAANGSKEPVSISVPYTIGMWDKTEPVEIELVKGKNVLTFSRGGENIKGLTIKDFMLTPVAK